MKREYVLSVLYDLTLTIGGETTVDALLRKALQRFLYHTAFPAGMVLTNNSTENDVTSSRIAIVIGDHLLEKQSGQIVNLPCRLTDSTIELLDDISLLDNIDNDGRYRYCLKLPVDDSCTFLLLSTEKPSSKLPLTQIFKPVLVNLSKSLLLCRNSEQLTGSLKSDRDQAKAALQESEKHLHTLIETLPDMIWLKDPDGVYLDCNPEFERFFGAKKAEILGKTDYDYVDKELADFFREKDKVAMEAGIPCVNEEEVIYADNGHRRLLETIKTPMFDTNGKLLGVLGIARDITGRKRAAEALRASEERFELAMAAANDGLWDWNIQTNTVYYSPRWKTMLGYEDNELDNVFSTWLQLIDSDDKAKIMALIDDCMAGKLESFEVELRMHHKQGHWLFILSRAIMVRDSNSQPIRMVGTHVDITERKQAEEALNRFKTTLDMTLDCVFMFDAESLRFLYVNQGAKHQVGYSDEELMQMTPVDIKPEFDEAGFRKMLKPLVNGEQMSLMFETVHQHKNGLHIPVEIFLQYIAHHDEAPRFIAIVRDLTERKEAERILVSKEKAETAALMKGQFLANMSHEIRTPLNGVLGLAKMGENSNSLKNSQELLRKIGASGQHLLHVVNDILDFSKIDVGKLVLEKHTFRLSESVSNVTNLIKNLATEKQLQFHINIASHLPVWIEGDSIRLEQILINLLSNAVKFTETGEISLNVEAQENRLLFKISDSGIGISETQLDNLFKPFEQADSSTTRRFGGTGLGLAISYNLAKLMGGNIQARSRLGEGSEFSLIIPFTSATPQFETDEIISETTGHRLHGRHLLAAEDVEINRMILEDILELEGAQISFAENGQQVLDLLEAHGMGKYDLILMDVQMPVMDGYEATHRLKLLAPELPVVGLTAHALDEERSKCFAAGMVDHITKPIDPEILIATIQRHFADNPPSR